MNNLSEILDDSREETVQKYLEKNPSLLLAAFGNRWVVNECIPKFKFGNEFISDFVIVTGQSFSYDITLIELEPPTERIFTQNGKYAKRLNDSIGQINDWLSWINDNMDYFKQSLAKKINNYYGASQINGLHTRRLFVSSKIIIGRRSMLTDEDNKRRATIYAQTNKTLEILPYDRLIEIEELNNKISS